MSKSPISVLTDAVYHNVVSLQVFLFISEIQKYFPTLKYIYLNPLPGLKCL